MEVFHARVHAGMHSIYRGVGISLYIYTAIYTYIHTWYEDMKFRGGSHAQPIAIDWLHHERMLGLRDAYN